MTWMMWNPYWLCTGPTIEPSAPAKAASENSWTNAPRLPNPRSPPLSLVSVSVEYCFASAANFVGSAFSCASDRVGQGLRRDEDVRDVDLFERRGFRALVRRGDLLRGDGCRGDDRVLVRDDLGERTQRRRVDALRRRRSPRVSACVVEFEDAALVSSASIWAWLTVGILRSAAMCLSTASWMSCVRSMFWTSDALGFVRHRGGYPGEAPIDHRAELIRRDPLIPDDGSSAGVERVAATGEKTDSQKSSGRNGLQRTSHKASVCRTTL